MAAKLRMDRWLAGTVLLLTLFGLTMVYSASAMVSIRGTGASYGFLFKQTVAALLGLGLLYAATRFDYGRLQHPAVIWGLLLSCIGLLLLVQATGNQRWLNFGGFSFQPSELTKLALLIYLADLLVRKQGQVGEIRGFLLPVLALLGTFCALIVIQPDLGTIITITLVAGCLFFVAGVPLLHLGGLAALGGLAFAALAWFVPYRRQRLLAFFGGQETEAPWQIKQSLTAIGSGGVSGVGLGESTQKLMFLPEAHNDFIFAVVGEELGLLGCLALVAAFLVLLWRGLRIALRARDPFGSYLVAGITLSLVVQAFINMGVVLNLLPTKGLTLPFVSYGGSSLLVTLLAAGLALNVSQHARG